MNSSRLYSKIVEDIISDERKARFCLQFSVCTVDLLPHLNLMSLSCLLGSQGRMDSNPGNDYTGMAHPAGKALISDWSVNNCL